MQKATVVILLSLVIMFTIILSAIVFFGNSAQNTPTPNPASSDAGLYYQLMPDTAGYIYEKAGIRNDELFMLQGARVVE